MVYSITMNLLVILLINKYTISCTLNVFLLLYLPHKMTKGILKWQKSALKR